LESAVQKRLVISNQTGGLPKQQSAYRRWHSTETALLKIYNDLLQAADRGEVSALCMLDISAACDSVDHELLLRRLEFRFGFTGDVLEWIKSYLTNRIFTVIYHAHKSSEVELECSVLQGSVLGPCCLSISICLYTAELADIAVKWNVNLHSYADDTQILLHYKLDTVSCRVILLEQCIDEIEQWMTANRLKLNADKTELLWTGMCSQWKKLTPMHPSLAVGETRRQLMLDFSVFSSHQT